MVSCALLGYVSGCNWAARDGLKVIYNYIIFTMYQLFSLEQFGLLKFANLEVLFHDVELSLRMSLHRASKQQQQRPINFLQRSAVRCSAMPCVLVCRGAVE